MPAVFALRHFRTDNNNQDILNGRSIQLPVSETRQIECGVQIDKVYCSTALRCRQTLEKFLETNNVRKIEYTKEILERSLGDMEGRPRQEMISAYPQLFTGSRLDIFATPPGGESYETFQKRASSFLNRTNLEKADEAENGSILICSHNQFLKMLYFTIHKKEIKKEAWNTLTFPFGEVIRIGG